jgi:pyruvate carboxylase subunit B
MKYKSIVNKNQSYDVTIEGETVTVNGEQKEVTLIPISDGFYQFVYNGKVYMAESEKSEDGYALKINGEAVSVDLKDEQQLLLEKLGVTTKKKTSSGEVRAPMPGLVVKIEVAVGDTVSVGQGLIILEAMKMQNEIKSSMAGTVKEILVSERQAVEKKFLLLKIE